MSNWKWLERKKKQEEIHDIGGMSLFDTIHEVIDNIILIIFLIIAFLIGIMLSSII